MGTMQHNAIDDALQMRLQDYGQRHDPLTGMPNRAHFRSWLRQALARAGKSGGEVALIWVDIVNLRREYSIGGEAGADRLLNTVADSLRPWPDQGEMVCRFSDRSFLIAIKRDECIEARINLMLDAASHRSMRGTEGKPEIAAGVAFYPEHTASSEELIRFASLAAASASRNRSRTATVYHSRMNTAIQNERDLEKDLRIALRENQLSLVYQPQIDLATGNIVGVEGLTRWHHATRGHVSPAEFIPVAEQSDLIDEIFSHSLRRLLIDVATWRKAGVVLPSAAVNASPANVRHEEFVSNVNQEMTANDPGETQLDIEVTESLLMDDEPLFVERLTALRAVGIKVSLDDFGTRYTGFNALKGLPLNTMKIDRCFVQNIDRSTQAQSLCRTMVTMARHLKLSTVAEGIEEIGELQTLKKLGCNGGQGYLFQRPIPSAQFLDFVRDWPQQKNSNVFEGAFLDVEVDPHYEVDPLYGLI